MLAAGPLLALASSPPAYAQAGVGYVDVVRSSAYFADGSVRDGFDEFLSVVNTNDQVGDVEVRFTARNDAGDNVLVLAAIDVGRAPAGHPESP